MVNIKRNLVLMFTFCFVGNANAGFMVEPYAGFALAGSLEQAATNPIAGTYSGLQFGGRAGFSMLGLMGGATYNMATAADYEFTQLTTTATNSAKRTDLGIFVGYELPVMLRVWGSYYLDSKLEGESTTGTTFIDSTQTWNGTGIGLGAGFTGLPFISINVEYKSFTFKDVDDSDSTPVNSVFTPEVTTNEIFVSVSLPLSF
jgi:hypothetical protein